MIEWLPTPSAEVENVAVPPLMVPVPSVVAPSLKVTVPLGELPPLRLAVSVTLAPTRGALEEALSAIAGVACETVTLVAAELTAALLVSPA